MQLDNNENDIFSAGCLWETHCQRKNSLDVVELPKRAEKMQIINRIFKYPLFRTKTYVFMLNVAILQLRLRSRHNPDIRVKYGVFIVSAWMGNMFMHTFVPTC